LLETHTATLQDKNGVNRVRGKRLISTSLVLALFLSLATINMAQATTPTIYVDPASPSAPIPVPGQTYTIYIKVSGAPKVSGWEFKLRWNFGVLKFPPTVTEGTFLKNPGWDTEFRKFMPMTLGYIEIGCTILPPPPGEPRPDPPIGSGTLAKIVFTVNDAGATDLDLFDVKLIDYDTAGEITPLDVVDGEFHTTVPFASFEIWPKKYWFQHTYPTGLPPESYYTTATHNIYVESDTPLGSAYWCTRHSMWAVIMRVYVEGKKDKLMTFDASASFDPDGGSIDSYSWNFGDGSTDSGKVVTHAFTAYRKTPYRITLKVTDHEGETWSTYQNLLVYRDIAVSDLWPTLDDWDLTTSNKMFARGSVEWMGPSDYCEFWGMDEYYPELTVIGTFTNMGFADEGITYRIYATHEATGTVYLFAESGLTLRAGLASGWGGWNYWWLLDDNGEYLPGGKYTITAEVDPLPGETEIANNAMSIEIEMVDFAFRPDLIMKRITNHAFSISQHGDTMWFYSKILNREYTVSDPCPPGTERSFVEFEIEDPQGKTIVLKTNEIDPATFAPDVEIVLDPQALSVSSLPFGVYSATAKCYFYFNDPTGNTNPWNKHFLSEKKIIAFSFSIRP